MLFPAKVFNIHDTIVASIGLFANILLFYIIIKRTSPAFKNYGRLILLSCVNDIIYSIVIILCQRIIELRNGSTFHMGYGIEEHSPHALALFIEFAEEVACLQSVTILPTQYYFRYVLVSKTREPTVALMAILTLGSTLESTIFGLLDVWTYFDARARGKEYYVKQLGPEWFDADGHVHFISSNDIQDLSTKVHFAAATFFTVTSYFLVIYFGYKTVKIIRSPLAVEQISKNTKAMTKQFTRNLLIQTCVALICAVLPATYICAYVVLQPRSDAFYGTGPFTSSLFAWTPAMNALVALFVIRPYRTFVLEMFCIRKPAATSISTFDTSQQKSVDTKTDADEEPMH